MSEIQRIRQKYPNRYPFIIHPENHLQPEIDKNKFLVPGDLTIGNLILVVKNRLKITKEKSLIFTIKFNGHVIIPETSALASSIYQRYSDYDGFIRIYYLIENAFG